MRDRTVFSNKTIIIMCLMALDCAAGYILSLVTGDTWKYLPVPPGFIYILALYWISLIHDIRAYRKRRRKQRRLRRTRITEKVLEKAG